MKLGSAASARTSESETFHTDLKSLLDPFSDIKATQEFGGLFFLFKFAV